MKPIQWITITVLSFGLFAILALDSADAGSKAAEAKKAIADLAAASTPKAKAAALDELGKIAQVQKSLVAAALPDIKKALADKDAIVRKAAAQAYGRCDPDAKEAVPLLTKMLKEETDDDVKIGVANGLAAMGPNASAAAPAVRDALRAEREKNKGAGQTRLSRELSETAKAIGLERKKN